MTSTRIDTSAIGCFPKGFGWLSNPKIRPNRAPALPVVMLNIRLSSKDLGAIQKRALAEGTAYQALIPSLLRQYATGRLREI